MPNIAKMLKDEIQRLARREIKAAVDGLRKDNAALKHTVADMKRRLAQVEGMSKRLAVKPAAKQSVSAEAAEENGDGEANRARISGKMIRALRAKLDLSQDAFARLAGVTSQTVYQWEHKTAGSSCAAGAKRSSPTCASSASAKPVSGWRRWPNKDKGQITKDKWEQKLENKMGDDDLWNLRTGAPGIPQCGGSLQEIRQ